NPDALEAVAGDPWRQQASQRADQVRPVGHAHERVDAQLLLEVLGLRPQSDPVAPAGAELVVDHPQRDGPDRIAGPDVIERPDRITPQADPGPDLAQLRRPLVDRHIEPDPTEGNGRRESCDPGTDDDDPHGTTFGGKRSQGGSPVASNPT